MLVQSGPKTKGLAMKVRENRSQLRPVVDPGQRIMCLSHIIIQSGAESDLPRRKGPDRGAERDLPRRKGPDLVADPPGENVLVRSRLGLGLARIAIPFHRKVGRRRVHVDVHIVILKLHLSGQGFWFRPSRPAMNGCLCWNQR